MPEVGNAIVFAPACVFSRVERSIVAASALVVASVDGAVVATATFVVGHEGRSEDVVVAAATHCDCVCKRGLVGDVVSDVIGIIDAVKSSLFVWMVLV